MIAAEDNKILILTFLAHIIEPNKQNSVHIYKEYVYMMITSASTHMFAIFKSFKLILLLSMQNIHEIPLYVRHIFTHIVSPHFNEMPSGLIRSYTKKVICGSKC